ncbi:MAG: AraC family transcriptional regulator [Bermanella sp.]
MNSTNHSFIPKIAVQLVRSLINYGERYGVHRTHMLKEASLTEDQLNDSRLLIDVHRYESLLLFISQYLKDPSLGFHHGQQFEAGRWGVLGLIASTSQSFQAAMEAQYRFQSLSGNMGAPLQSSEDGITTLQWVPAYNCSYHLAEQVVTGLVSLARELTNQVDYAPNCVSFTHKPHGDAALYEAYFQCPVTFNASYNGLEVDDKLLQVPLRKSDTETHKVLLAHAQAMLEEQTFTSPLEVIKDYVVKTLPSHVPDIEEVSQYLNLSVRSTQRKLHEYGTSYSQVLDAIRKELALTYLRQTHNSVLYVSERLGFSEQSAFQRAFKRWTGSTPKRYRDATVVE